MKYILAIKISRTYEKVFHITIKHIQSKYIQKLLLNYIRQQSLKYFNGFNFATVKKI